MTAQNFSSVTNFRVCFYVGDLPVESSLSFGVALSVSARLRVLDDESIRLSMPELQSKFNGFLRDAVTVPLGYAWITAPPKHLSGCT